MLAIEFMVVRFNMIILCTVLGLSQAFRETCLKQQSQYFYIRIFSYSATSNPYTKQITTLNSLLCQKGQFTPLIERDVLEDGLLGKVILLKNNYD